METPPIQEPPEFIEVTDLGQFIEFTTDWHAKKVAELEHILLVPAGNSVEVTDKATDTTTEVILEGDKLVGFKAGIELALAYLGSLPFTEIPEVLDDELVIKEEGVINESPQE